MQIHGERLDIPTPDLYLPPHARIDRHTGCHDADDDHDDPPRRAVAGSYALIERQT